MKQKKEQKIFYLVIIIVLILSLITLILIINNIKILKSDLKDNFAQCLTNKGVKYYHSFQCPHCKAQDEMFGNAKRYLPIIECGALDGSTEWNKECVNNNVYSVPQWHFPNGAILYGTQPLEVLAKESGC